MASIHKMFLGMAKKKNVQKYTKNLDGNNLAPVIANHAPLTRANYHSDLKQTKW